MAWGPMLMDIHDPHKFSLFIVFSIFHSLYLVLLLCAIMNWEAPSIGLAIGLATVPLIVGVPSLFIMGVLSGGLDQLTAQAVKSIFPGAVALVPGALLAFAKSKQKQLSVGAGLAGCMVVLLFLSASWSAWGTSSSSANGEPMDQKAVYNWFNHISACNQKFASQNPDKGFVVSLAQLGPAGTQCLSQEEVTGPIGARKPQYEPGLAQNGKISTYHLRTQDPGFFTDSYPLVTDQRAVIVMETKDEKHVVPDVNGFGRGVAENLSRYSLCLDYLRKKNGTFPATLKATINLVDCFPKESNNVFHYSSDNILTDPYYVFTYSPILGEASGRFDNFNLNARPQKYGITGIRSYLVSKDYVVHATPEDRVALPSDPSDVRYEH